MTFRRLSVLLVVLGSAASTASASTTMIRLGYARCSACHLTPEGAGLLTDYGKGIDLAQSLKGGEYVPPDPTESPKFRADIRMLTSGYLTTPSDTGGRPAPPSWLRAYLRNSATLGAHNRLAATIMMEAPAGSVSMLWESKPHVQLLGGWEYRPTEAFSVSIVRDRLPRGVELGETRTFLQDFDTDKYPTQLRMFLTTHLFHVTAYAFAPGSKTMLDHHTRGIGLLGEVLLAGNHLALGVSARHAQEDAPENADERMTGSKLERRSVGGYARLGFGKWGVLAEHERTKPRIGGVTVAGPDRWSGYTQFFFVPKEWLVTSLIAEQSNDTTELRERSFRWRPEVQARLTPNVTITASARTDKPRGATSSSRIYLVQLAVKTVQ
jgi:hypothetical protein